MARARPGVVSEPSDRPDSEDSGPGPAGSTYVSHGDWLFLPAAGPAPGPGSLSLWLTRMAKSESRPGLGPGQRCSAETSRRPLSPWCLTSPRISPEKKFRIGQHLNRHWTWASPALAAGSNRSWAYGVEIFYESKTMINKYLLNIKLIKYILDSWPIRNN